MELDIEPCHLRWVHTTSEEAAAVCEQEVYSLVSTDTASALSVSDVNLLVGIQEQGSEIVSPLQQFAVRLNRNPVSRLAFVKQFFSVRKACIDVLLGPITVQTTVTNYLKRDRRC